MSVTYTDSPMSNASSAQDAFVPRYARAKRAKKGVRTWMILAPIGAVVLVGGGAAMMMSGGETQPLAEPAPTPAVQPLASVPAPLDSSTAPAALTANAIEPAAAPAPVVREAIPTPALAPVTQRRAIPTPAPAETAVATPSEAVVEPTGPRPYTAEAGAATAPAPAIQTAPLT